MAVRLAEAGRSSSAIERRAVIVNMTMEKGVVSISEITQLFGVSEVTARHDLDVLAQQGIVIRQRGGAIAQVHTSLARAIDQQSRVNLEAKGRIGAYAARLVQPGDTIMMDAGTTVMEMAKRLHSVAPVTVVTNAMNVASQIVDREGSHVILLGGSLSPETVSTVGPLAERALSDLLVTKLFLGAHTVDAQAGIVDTSMEIARVKRAMIQTANKVILLADSSKWTTRSREAFARVAPLTAVHMVITDGGLPADIRSVIERLGVELCLV
jgi:DeoR/GlpR family transcriptional regulator of sugar metabolism